MSIFSFNKLLYYKWYTQNRQKGLEFGRLFKISLLYYKILVKADQRYFPAVAWMFFCLVYIHTMVTT